MTQGVKSIKIPVDLHHKIKELAFKYDVQIKILVAEILKQALEDKAFLEKVLKNITKEEK